jgi:hypothetical protein
MRVSGSIRPRFATVETKSQKKKLVRNIVNYTLKASYIYILSILARKSRVEK